MDWKFFVGLVRRHRVLVAAFVACALVIPLLELLVYAALLLLVTPQNHPVVSEALESRLGPSPLTSTDAVPYVIVSGTLAVIVAVITIRWARGHVMARLKFGVLEEFSTRTLTSYLALPPWRLAETDRSAFATAVVFESVSLATAFHFALDLGIQVLALLVFLGASLSFSPVLVLIVGGLSAVGFLVNYRLYGRMERVGAAKAESQKEMLRETNEVVRVAERVKIEGLEDSVMDRLRGAIDRRKAWLRTRLLTQDAIGRLSDASAWIAIIAVILVGFLVLNEDAGTLLVLMLLFNRTRGYLLGAQGAFVQLKSHLPSARRAIGLVADLERGRERPPVARGVPRRIRFDGVRLDHDGAAVLSDVNLDLRAGDRVFVHGPSGQGKSTLLKLALGILRPTSGRVVVEGDGESYDARLEELREHAFYCRNDLATFDGSFHDVVDYARRSESGAVREALHKVGLGDVLLSEGARGMTGAAGTDGDRLSLGERQRLLLAGLFLRRPAIVVLDEVTAHMDRSREEAVLRAIREHIAEDSILLLASHRMPSEFSFTKVVHVDKGLAAIEPPPLAFTPGGN